MTGQDEPLAVSIDAKGRVYIQDSEVELDRLIPAYGHYRKQPGCSGFHSRRRGGRLRPRDDGDGNSQRVRLCQGGLDHESVEAREKPLGPGISFRWAAVCYFQSSRTAR